MKRLRSFLLFAACMVTLSACSIHSSILLHHGHRINMYSLPGFVRLQQPVDDPQTCLDTAEWRSLRIGLEKGRPSLHAPMPALLVYTDGYASSFLLTAAGISKSTPFLRIFRHTPRHTENLRTVPVTLFIPLTENMPSCLFCDDGMLRKSSSFKSFFSSWP